MQYSVKVLGTTPLLRASDFSNRSSEDPNAGPRINLSALTHLAAWRITNNTEAVG